MTLCGQFGVLGLMYNTETEVCECEDNSRLRGNRCYKLMVKEEVTEKSAVTMLASIFTGNFLYTGISLYTGNIM